MILVICGPTGSGKTLLSEKLALLYDAIIINADASQIYREMNIGTAKIKESEKLASEHFLFDVANVDSDFTVVLYQKMVREILKKNENKNIILVGGSGLYIKACLYDYKFNEISDDSSFDSLSNSQLYNKCLLLDKECQIHVNNRVRLINFLKNYGNIDTCGSKLLYDAHFIGLKADRDLLYEKINCRVDVMIEDGLFDEVKFLFEKYGNCNILKRAIGYKEAIDYFLGNISFDASVCEIKKNSRRYAKRQMTWFNNKMQMKWFDVNFLNFDLTINEVCEYIGEFYEL